MLIRSGGKHGAAVFPLPFPAAPAFLLPSCQILPFSISVASRFLEAPSARVWILRFVVQARGTLCINLGNSLGMVTGNLLIAMEIWACYKLFRFALGHRFGTCWLGARSPLALGLSDARHLDSASSSKVDWEQQRVSFQSNNIMQP